MDLVSSCQNKLASFRVKELKEVLTHLGKGKQGRKQDLMNRILDCLTDEQEEQVSRPHLSVKKRSMGREEVAKIIEDMYSKMYPGPKEFAAKSHSNSDLKLEKPQEEVVNDTSKLDKKVRCPCGSLLMSDSMIKCGDLQCQVWQHVGCVVIPEKPVEGVQPEMPSCFHCELCRINKSDPFWLTVKHPLPPVKLTTSGIASDGTNIKQNAEKTFSLSREDQEMLRRNDYDLQAWCVLLNDKVPFRVQWPQYAELQVNGIPVRAIHRPGSQLLGIGGRDDGAIITTCTWEGINKVCLSRCDARIFCFGIRIAKRWTVEQVLSLVPKETDGEQFEDALGRVRRCIGGGASIDNADSDSDLEVVAESVTVNLRCPMSGSRIRVAGRFRSCNHMGGFDLEAFVELSQRSRKWQCPICLQNYSLENIIIDPYFNRITTMLKNCGEDVNEIEVKPDGCWRAKNEGKCHDLTQWHNPDGTLYVTINAEVKSDTAISKQIKPEDSSEGRTSLKLGIKRNRDGRWEVKKQDDVRSSSSGNHLLNKFENPCQNTKPRSSSATGSHKDGEDGSVNQEGGTHFDFSSTNSLELDSLPLNFEPTYINNANNLPNTKDSDVIVLSDSEENVTVISPGTANVTNQAEGLINNAGNDFSIPLWQIQSGNNYNLFGMESIADAQHSLASAPTNGYNLALDGGLGDINGSLVDNPLAFGGDDPSLQIFLPSRAGSDPMQIDLMASGEMPDGMQSDEWVSLTLAGGHNIDPASVNGLDPGQHDADLFSMMNEGKLNRATSNGQRPDNTSLHPQLPCPAKPPYVLSIDTDSE